MTKDTEVTGLRSLELGMLLYASFNRFCHFISDMRYIVKYDQIISMCLCTSLYPHVPLYIMISLYICTLTAPIQALKKDVEEMLVQVQGFSAGTRLVLVQVQGRC